MLKFSSLSFLRMLWSRILLPFLPVVPQRWHSIRLVQKTDLHRFSFQTLSKPLLVRLILPWFSCLSTSPASFCISPGCLLLSLTFWAHLTSIICWTHMSTPFPFTIMTQLSAYAIISPSSFISLKMIFHVPGPKTDLFEPISTCYLLQFTNCHVVLESF